MNWKVALYLTALIYVMGFVSGAGCSSFIISVAIPLTSQ